MVTAMGEDHADRGAIGSAPRTASTASELLEENARWHASLSYTADSNGKGAELLIVW